MPIQKPSGLRRLSKSEFGAISYSVMHHAFQVHKEMGCFFDECIYKNALKNRVGAESETEVKISITFDDFYHEYFLDLLVEHGAVFELKRVEDLAGIHRSQLMNYLLLCDLSHGKLINFGTPNLQHEFVNAYLLSEDRKRVETTLQDWLLRDFSDWMKAFVEDVGVGLDVGLYEKAAVHFFGGEQQVLKPVEIVGLGFQTLSLTAPDWGLKVTTLPPHAMPSFIQNTKRFLGMTKLAGFHWVNISRQGLLFRSLAL